MSRGPRKPIPDPSPDAPPVVTGTTGGDPVRKEKPLPNVTLSVATSDNSFSSAFTFPLDASEEETAELVKLWLSQMQLAIKIAVRRTTPPEGDAQP